MKRLPFDATKCAARKAARAKAAAAPLLPAPAPDAPPGAEGLGPVHTVGQINALIQQAIVTHLPPVLLVQGEISNFRIYDRGHAFFTLKEPGAELPCVMWRDAVARLKFKPADGMAVIARGNIKLYEPQGRVQLYVETLLPQGTGALELAFRQLCAKLQAEGLFAPERKRPIPRLPQRVVIVTSRSGDVLHDVLTTAYRRYPGLHTMLYPVAVQGATAAPQIVAALETINRCAAALGGVDLILLVRGGGSLEDLWAFNEEAVARAIVASKIPIATGIGHEPDTTIADLVGDLRGPTPTGVTELTIPDVHALARALDATRDRLAKEVRRQIENAHGRAQRAALELAQAFRQRLRDEAGHLEQIARAIAGIEPRHAIAQGWRRVEDTQRRLHQGQRDLARRAADHVQRLEMRLHRATPAGRLARSADRTAALHERLRQAMAVRLQRQAAQLAAAQRQLTAVGPQAVLERGYSITTDARGTIIRSKAEVARGDVIKTRVADGTFESTVGQSRQGRLF